MKGRERAVAGGAVSGDGRLLGALADGVRPVGDGRGVDCEGNFEEGIDWDVKRFVFCLFIKS